MTKDSTLKIIIFSVMAFVVLWLISSVLFPSGYGVSVSYNMPRVTSYGYNINYGFINLLTSFIQVLLVVFIITLILGAVSLIKNSLVKSDDEISKDITTNDSDQENTEMSNVNLSWETNEATSVVQSSEILEAADNGEISEVKTSTEETTLIHGETNTKVVSEKVETEQSILEKPETMKDETNHTVEEKTTCPECGHELDPEWKICLNCGKELKKSRKRKNKNTEN